MKNRFPSTRQYRNIAIPEKGWELRRHFLSERERNFMSVQHVRRLNTDPFLKSPSAYFKVREGQVVQGILESGFVLGAPLASRPSEKSHWLLQPLHRVVVVFLLVRHLCQKQKSNICWQTSSTELSLLDSNASQHWTDRFSSVLPHGEHLYNVQLTPVKMKPVDFVSILIKFPICK